MRYLKLFEEMKIEENEFPEQGHDISPREIKILTDLVGERYLSRVSIKVEDHYYYTKINSTHLHFNRFDTFNELKKYLISRSFIYYNKPEEYLELLKTSNLDPSFDNNLSIKWASEKGHIEIFRFLLRDPRVDPSAENNYCLKYVQWKLKGPFTSTGRSEEIVDLLLNDKRVRDKLTEDEIRVYDNL